MTQITPTRDEAVRETAIAICEKWLETFAGRKITHVSAHEYAEDAVRDIIDHIRAIDIAPAPASGRVDAEAREGAIGWNSPEEWEIEQRAFHAAGREDVPKDVQELVAILWKQYCIAAEPASLSPAATPVSEAEPDLATNFFRMTPSEVHAALAKPASSPAGGGVVERLAELERYCDEQTAQAFSDFHRAEQEGDTEHADKMRGVRNAYSDVTKRLRALSQSTSAGRVGDA